MNCAEQDLLLYAVTDRHWLHGRTLHEVVKESLDGGVTFLQLREKDLDEARFLDEAKDIKTLCHAYGVPFLINDNVDIALAVDADGVHVGQSDMEAGDVRAKLGPDKIIGAINFNIFRTSREPYAEIGYKIDALYQNRGIAYEACEAALYVLEHDYQIHRVDARIHPENIASITLATKLGFRPLQFEPQSANILGHYVDLMRYTKLL